MTDGRQRRARLPLKALCGIAMLLLLAPAASSAQAPGATLTVDSTADDLTPGDGQCTLREALINANDGGDATGGDCAAGGGRDRIELPAGHYTLSLPGDGEDLGATGDLDVLDDVTLHGAGAAVTTIDAGGMAGVVAVHGVEAVLDGLTLTGSDRRYKYFSGAALENLGGVLALEDSIVRGNTAAACFYGYGCAAGVANLHGTTTIRRSLLTDNQNGAVFTVGGATRIENSTISRNRGGVIFCGYGCYEAGVITAEGPLSLIHSSVADNLSYGGALSGDIELRASVLSNPYSGNCGYYLGYVYSSGGNLGSDESCSLSEPTDLSGIDPLLGGLAANGGPTPSHALLLGSPAIDAIPVSACTQDHDGDPLTLEVPVVEDQRGVVRPSEGSGTPPSDCDIGALEVNECGDGLDNDSDGLADAADFGCASAADTSEQAPPFAACSDTADNDGDGLVDLADPECSGAADTSEHVLPVCGDGVDDDADGLIDLEDPGCTWFTDASEQDASLVCDDGVDNDADGLVDTQDPGCATPFDSSEQNPGCNDSLDNDLDGLVDQQDPGCASLLDETEWGPGLVCDDGVDNDGDNTFDLRDPGCASIFDPSEQNPSGPACDDGIDNDGDNHVDISDSSCASPAETSEFDCDDGINNDYDGLIDLLDPGCVGPTDTSEYDPATQCDDGLDNDGDGRPDGNDPSCASPTDSSEVDCDDAFDNDGDGLSDLQDPGCDSPADTNERGDLMCDDGYDNDQDGLVDQLDPTCTSPAGSEFTCLDRIDNDGDGFVDLKDPGCESAYDQSERNSAVACDDGYDNDGDGLADLQDPSCASPSGTSEQSSALACDDGLDNDGDGRVDLADPVCRDVRSLTERSQCQDGRDNDRDGRVDFDGGRSRGVVGKRIDPNCAGKPWKDSEGRRPRS